MKEYSKYFRTKEGFKNRCNLVNLKWGKDCRDLCLMSEIDDLNPKYCEDNTNCSYKSLHQQLKQKEQRIEFLENGYGILTNFISTRMLDDFTGYNEEANGFDIIQAIKEVIEYQESENTILQNQVDELKEELNVKVEKFMDSFRDMESVRNNKLLSEKQMLIEAIGLAFTKSKSFMGWCSLKNCIGCTEFEAPCYILKQTLEKLKGEDK